MHLRRLGLTIKNNLYLLGTDKDSNEHCAELGIITIKLFSLSPLFTFAAIDWILVTITRCIL